MSFQIDFPAQPRFPILAPNGSVSAPSYSFSGDTNCGFYYVGSDVVGLAANGAVGLRFGQGVIDIPSDVGLLRFGAGVDTVLTREAANTLALRNSTNAQTFRVYNTYTDASNYERGYAGWTSNIFFVGAEAAGTGTKRPVRLSGGGVEISPLAGTTTAAWYFNSAGHFLANADNTYDIGASGATRPRNLNLGQHAYIAGSIYLASNVRMTVNGDGVLSLLNFGSTDFGQVNLGGTTASFPAIARDGAGVKFTGASGTSVSWMKVPGVTVANLPAAATAGAGARSFVTDALTPVFGSAVVAGGAVTVPVYSTGSAWNVG